MMTFRVSHVEAFRRYQQEEDAKLEDLLANIRGERPATPPMEAGTAFHKALELAPIGQEFAELRVDGYTFRFVGDFELRLSTIRELLAERDRLAAENARLRETKA